MPQTDAPTTADLIARLDALFTEPPLDLAAIRNASAALRAAAEPRVKELLRRLDALIGGRHRAPAYSCAFRHAYSATPEEKALWDELWHLLGQPGVPPVALPVDCLGPTDYALAALTAEVCEKTPGMGGDIGIGIRDWRGRVWAGPNTVRF